MTWLVLGALVVLLLLLARGYGRAASKDESIARINRTGLQDDTFGPGTGTGL